MILHLAIILGIEKLTSELLAKAGGVALLVPCGL